MCDDKNFLTQEHPLVPVLLLGFALLVILTSQTVQMVHDRNFLRVNLAQQEKLVEGSQKLRAQIEALVLGTIRLSDSGNTNVKPIVARLKQMGLLAPPPETAPPSASGMAPVPASTETPSSSTPVKP